MTEAGKETLFHVMTVGSFCESSPFRYARFSKLKESNIVISVNYFLYRLNGCMERRLRLPNAIRKIQVQKILGGGLEKVSFFSVVKEVLMLLGDKVCLSSDIYDEDTLEDVPDNVTVDHIGIGNFMDILIVNIRATNSAVNCQIVTLRAHQVTTCTLRPNLKGNISTYTNW